MPGHAVVAVAASAGGVEAFKRFVRGLPQDLPATVLLALHLPPEGQSMLAGIVRRHSAMTVRDAADGLELCPGEVIVAQPDHHLLVRDGKVVLGRGARENGHRPSHDAMLRSVGLASGPYAVGVVLTGLLDDGANGLSVVERYGGACLVQEPSDAEFPSMPRHALAAVPTARAVPLEELAEEVQRIVKDVPTTPAPEVPEDLRQVDLAELGSALGQTLSGEDGEPFGSPSSYGCPDCHGVLNELPAQGPLRLRCRTGHAWTAESLLARQSEEVETALWTALRVLEERTQMAHELAAAAQEGRRGWSAQHFRRRADEARRSAELLRSLLVPAAPSQAAPERGLEEA